MQINSTVDFINKEIKRYGTNIYGDPIFRVVFSNDQAENRKVRRSGQDEIVEISKYPWIERKWILERWAPGSLAYHPSLVTVKDGVYICVYVFQDKDKNYLPPLLKVAEIVIKALMNPLKASEIQQRDALLEEKKEAASDKKLLEELEIERDLSSTKDPKSIRDSLSTGYGEEKRRTR